MNPFIIRILNRLGLLSKVNTSLQKRINKQDWNIPVLHSLGLEYLYLDEGKDGMYYLFDKLIHKLKIDTFYDIGCNIGQTLVKVKSIKPELDYYGFDLNPANFYYLYHLIRFNRLDHTRIYPVALSNEFWVIDFLLNNITDTGATINRENRPGFSKNSAQGFVMPLDNLKDYLPGGGKNFLLKIDVEGAEYNTLLGMKEFLMNTRPVIVVEILDSYNKETMRSVDLERNKSLMSLFSELNYDLYQYQAANKRLIKRNEIESKLYTRTNDCDYLLWPKEKPFPESLSILR